MTCWYWLTKISQFCLLCSRYQATRQCWMPKMHASNWFCLVLLWGILKSNTVEHTQSDTNPVRLSLSTCSSIFICFCKQKLCLAKINHVIYFSQQWLLVGCKTKWRLNYKLKALFFSKIIQKCEFFMCHHMKKNYLFLQTSQKILNKNL